jgi:hypothetical protein
MSGLHPTNGTSVLAATPANDGLVDSLVGELTYLAQALRDNAPLPQAPVMGGNQPEDRLDATPSFGPAPGRTFH